jgi:hypothetical protein
VPLFRGRKKIDYISLVKAASPYAYYPLTEAVGAPYVAVDVVSGRNMTIGSEISKPTTLKCGAGFQQNDDALNGQSLSALKERTIYRFGTGDTGESDIHAMIRLNQATGFTIEAWVDNLGESDTTYANQFQLTVGAQVIGFRVVETSLNTCNFFASDDGLRQQYANGVQTGWHHICLNFLAGGNDLYAYIDGVKYATAVTCGTLKTDSYYPGVVLLGMAYASGSNNYIGYGAIAHVAFYNKLLTQQEIALHYEYGKNG